MNMFNSQSERAVLPERRPAQPAAAAPASGLQYTGSPQAGEAPQRRPSVLGKTLVFKGELSADEDLVLQGRVEGSIHHTQSITVGVDGVVIGDVHARAILIEGTVEGDLHGSASVLIAATAKVRGNIVAPRVGIMEGANFNGGVDMSAAQSTATVRGPSVQSTTEITLEATSVERILNRP